MESSSKQPGNSRNGLGRSMQVSDTANLLADLRKMLNNEEYSDLQFICNDKVRLHASRFLLEARSPALKRMILNESRERKKEISLPFVSSPVFLSVLEFLYTGMIVEHVPLSTSKAYDLINVAKEYFQLDKVEQIGWEFLDTNEANIRDHVMRAAVRLSVDVEPQRLSVDVESRDVAYTMDAVKTLSSKELKPIHLRWLSEKALRHLLDATKGMTDPGTPSFGEYRRFRLIIQWCAVRRCPDQAEDVVNACLPDELSVASLLTDRRKLNLLLLQPREKAVHGAELASILSKEATRLHSLLEVVDFRCVHPELLTALVEPLNIVSASKLSAAFQFQALHWPRLKMNLRARYQWQHGSSNVAVESDHGYVLSKIRPEIGFARFFVPIFRPYGVYKWDIIVEEPSTDFCEIGFHVVGSLSDPKPQFLGTLSQQARGWALSMDIKNRTQIKQGGSGRGWVPFGKYYDKVNPERVGIHLDMFKRRCSFSMDNGEYEVAWSDLPDGVYYPAVSLGSERGTTGRVRIELVNGSNFNMQ